MSKIKFKDVRDVILMLGTVSGILFIDLMPCQYNSALTRELCWRALYQYLSLYLVFVLLEEKYYLLRKKVYHHYVILKVFDTKCFHVGPSF